MLQRQPLNIGLKLLGEIEIVIEPGSAHGQPEADNDHCKEEKRQPALHLHTGCQPHSQIATVHIWSSLAAARAPSPNACAGSITLGRMNPRRLRDVFEYITVVLTYTFTSSCCTWAIGSSPVFHAVTSE